MTTKASESKPSTDPLDRIALNMSIQLGHLSTLPDSARKSELYQTIMRVFPEKELTTFFNARKVA
jgi:hypothetical protein